MALFKRILAFNNQLHVEAEKLPSGVLVLNPFKGENAKTVEAITHDFYTTYYNDDNQRIMIFGINPGRMGAGLTGVPFTDTWCLENKCGISAGGLQTRETSARFVFDLIDGFGGPDLFFRKFFIGATSPLGYVKLNSKNTYVNYNYYDSKQLQDGLQNSIEKWYYQQFELGMSPNVAYCLGTGKNFQYLQKLNERIPLYREIIPLEHPRYIMQYKLKEKDAYIERFVQFLTEAKI